MRASLMLALAALAAVPTAAPAGAKQHSEPARYEYNGHVYNSLEECREERKKAEKKGTIVGAVGGAATVAVLGGNVGGAALGAGVGALGGNLIGKGSKKC